MRLPEHSHCDYCGDAIPFGESFCNEECRESHDIEEIEEKKKEHRFFGTGIAILIALGIVGIISFFIK